MLIPALLGLLFFLILLRWTHPPTYLPQLAQKDQVIEESRDFLLKAGFDADGLEPYAVLRTNDELISQQISRFGKSQVNEFIRNGFLRFIPSYYWQISWISTDDHEDVSITMDSYRQPFGVNVFRTVHSIDGAIQRFNLENKRGAKQRMQTPWDLDDKSDDEPDDVMPDFLAMPKGPLMAEILEHRHLKSLLRGTVWDNHLMSIDSTYQSGQQGEQLHNAVLVPQADIFGHVPRVTVRINQEGRLLGIDQEVYINGYQASETESPGGFIRAIFYVIAALLLFALFIRRLFHRLVDLRSASINGGMAAILFLIHMIQVLIQGSAFALIDQQFLQIIAMVLIMAVLSVFFGIFIFMIAGLGESMTRESWPEKITSMSLVRMGYFDSRRVGNAIGAGVLGAFMLLGLASILYTISDHTYLNLLDDHLFYAESYLLPAWHIFAQSLLWTFLIAAGLFACFISWVAINKRHTLLLLACGGVALSLMTPLHMTTPDSYIIFAIIIPLGIAATWIFIRQDILALSVSLLLFFAAWLTVDSRLVSGSPDALLGWTVLGVMILLLAAGVWVAEYGKTYDHIPDLTPKYILEIAREQRVERELEIAHQVHQSFLPVDLPALGGLEVAASCQAAFDVGGDYYDVIPVDDHRMAFVIGDVSGKGIQAAFFMTMVKGIFQSLVKEIPDPAPLLTRMNRLFYDNARRGSFISICYGLIDVRNGMLKYARAGHNPAIVIRSAEQKAEIIRSRGLAIGLTRSTDFENSLEEVSIRLQPGDGVVFYTDGVTEAVNPARQMFGEDRLVAEVRKHYKLDADDLLLQLTTSINRFASSTPVSDDMTMVIVRYLNSSTRMSENS